MIIIIAKSHKLVSIRIKWICNWNFRIRMISMVLTNKLWTVEGILMRYPYGFASLCRVDSYHLALSLPERNNKDSISFWNLKTWVHTPDRPHWTAPAEKRKNLIIFAVQTAVGKTTKFYIHRMKLNFSFDVHRKGWTMTKHTVKETNFDLERCKKRSTGISPSSDITSHMWLATIIDFECWVVPHKPTLRLDKIHQI